MSCAAKLEAISRVLELSDLSLADRAVAAYLIINPMKAERLVSCLGVSRTTAYRIVKAVAPLIGSIETETRVPSVGQKRVKRVPSVGLKSPECGTHASPECGTENGRNQPIPDIEPRERVDSDSFFLKEEEGKKERERAKALSTRASAREDEPRGFAEFYLAYPRKEGKPSAVKAFRKAIKNGAAVEEIIEGLRRYRFSSDPDFRPLPATWLNDERWQTPLRPQAPVRSGLPPLDQDPLMGMVRL